MSRFSNDFFVPQCRKNWQVKHSVPCFRNIPVAKKFIDKRVEGGGWGISRLSIEFFLSHSAKKFRRGILYCCNIFGYRKILDKRGGEYQVFPWKNFLYHSAKSFRRGNL